MSEPQAAPTDGVDLAHYFRRRRVPVWFEARGRVTRDGDRFTLATPSDELRLRPKGRRIPSGWVLVTYRLTARDLPSLTPYLRVTDSHGAVTRIDLQSTRGGQGRDVVLLPDDTVSISMGLGRATEIVAKQCTFTELGEVWLLSKTAKLAAAKGVRNRAGARTEVARMRSEGDDLQTTKHTLLNLAQGQLDRSYERWIEQYDTRSDADRAAMERLAHNWEHPPQIRVVIDANGATAEQLARTTASLMRQPYPHWSAAVYDCDSTNRLVVSRAGVVDERISFGDEAPHATHVCFLTGADLVSDHALFSLAADAVALPDIALRYTDEDVIDDSGHRSQPDMKPDWDPVFAASRPIANRLGLWTVDAFVGLPDRAYSTAELAELAAELSSDEVRHLPVVGYHRNAANVETAEAVTSPLAVPSDDDLQRVSAIVCTRDRPELLGVSMRGLLEQTDYPDLEVIIVDNGTTNAEALDQLERFAQDERVTVIRHDAPFNFSELNNLGASHATGELLLLLNNDIEVTEGGWLRHMVALAQRDDVGAVGARLDYPDGSLQHGGVVVGMGGVAGHVLKHLPAGQVDSSGRVTATRQVGAVTAAAMVLRREVFDTVGGFDAESLTVAFNDVDLCIRIRNRGLMILWTPDARLVHHESVSRGRDTSSSASARFAAEIEVMRSRWAPLLDSGDPFHSPNLANDREDGSLAFPPRYEPIWLD